MYADVHLRRFEILWIKKFTVLFNFYIIIILSCLCVSQVFPYFLVRQWYTNNQTIRTKSATPKPKIISAHLINCTFKCHYCARKWDCIREVWCASRVWKTDICKPIFSPLPSMYRYHVCLRTNDRSHRYQSLIRRSVERFCLQINVKTTLVNMLRSV